MSPQKCGCRGKFFFGLYGESITENELFYKNKVVPSALIYRYNYSHCHLDSEIKEKKN